MISCLQPADPAFVRSSLDEKGYALLPAWCSPEQCTALAHSYDQQELYRKTIAMERYRFGRGEYKYFRYPLPTPVQEMRTWLYTLLAPMANDWMHRLQINTSFPATLPELQARCRQHQQDKATVLTLKYHKGGYNTLHQDIYGDVWFPIQAVLLLNQVGTDYSGGAFVMTEQVPRAQSKAIVLQPDQGDLLLFTTSFRPVKGSRGYYRAQMKHGISEVHEGTRQALGIIFHDALT